MSADADGAAGSPSDRIALRGLRVHGRHGVFDHERANGQDFVVDVVLELDTSAAACTDALEDTVDYGKLANTVAAIVAGEPVQLLETLADRIATACLTDARVVRAEVSVHKPHAPIDLAFDDVVVTIVRAQRAQG
jgi:dihydroneopterin aldolase